MRVDVQATFPHDPEAFTQGLVWHNGNFFESTGLYGRSSLRGVTLEDGGIRRKVDLDRQYFGEGLALHAGRLIQLTWKAEVAFVYDAFSFAEVARFDYDGEGWGLCSDGEALVMSNGGTDLYFRDPETFEILRRVTVTRDGRPVARLNELECVDEVVYANVWMTDEIVVIDPTNGRVLSTIDASGLLSEEERRAADVLNGIAYDPQAKQFYITGKLWPKMFRVRFVAK